MAFHTASLLGAGIYLLLMAGAGYYLRLFGGEWGDVVQTVFLFAAAMLLVLLMFSGTLRARLRVFLSKHFFSYRYDYREEWLNFTRPLTEGQPGERAFPRPGAPRGARRREAASGAAPVPDRQALPAPRLLERPLHLRGDVRDPLAPRGGPSVPAGNAVGADDPRPRCHAALPGLRRPGLPETLVGPRAGTCSDRA